VPETVMPGEDSRHHLFFKRIGNFFIHPENSFPAIFFWKSGLTRIFEKFTKNHFLWNDLATVFTCHLLRDLPDLSIIGKTKILFS
jgi:hypothetical protein